MVNEERCKEIYEQYWALVRYLANKRGIAYEDLEDICQEVFASFFRTYGKIVHTWNEKQIKAALVKSVMNETIDYYRRNSNKKEFVCYENDEVVVKASPHNEEEEIMVRMELAAIIAYIDKMQPISRLIARGYFLDGLTIDELSAETGIAQAAIRMRITRIRKEIRKKFKGEVS